MMARVGTISIAMTLSRSAVVLPHPPCPPYSRTRTRVPRLTAACYLASSAGQEVWKKPVSSPALSLPCQAGGLWCDPTLLSSPSLAKTSNKIPERCWTGTKLVKPVGYTQDRYCSDMVRSNPMKHWLVGVGLTQPRLHSTGWYCSFSSRRPVVPWAGRNREKWTDEMDLEMAFGV